MRTWSVRLSTSVRYAVWLERASARETAVRVAAGAIARQLLRLFGIETIGYVTEVGGLAVETPTSGRSMNFERCATAALCTRLFRRAIANSSD